MHAKTDAAHAVMVPESEESSFFIFCRNVVIQVNVINDEGNGR
jgi:hypothetical protein